MVEVIMKPILHGYKTCREFADEFKLGDKDLILTNEYIYTPYFGQLGLSCHTLFQEQYGAGEPTDVMAEAIMADALKTGARRIVAVGGGTIIDLAKVLAVAGDE